MIACNRVLSTKLTDHVEDGDRDPRADSAEKSMSGVAGDDREVSFGEASALRTSASTGDTAPFKSAAVRSGVVGIEDSTHDG